MTRPVWGCPWHGPVRGGVLSLPNGATLPWAQHVPAAGYPPDTAGYTLRQRLPGVQPVQRSVEELAADQAAGRQWWHQAIVSGSGDGTASVGYLHGRNVGGWIYAAPDGSRWLVKGLGRLPWQAGYLKVDLTLVRFGQFGAAPDATSSWKLIGNDAIGQPLNAGGDGCYARVEDITADGAQAIVMLYTENGGVRRRDAHGFVLLALSGTPGVDFALQLAPLRSAAQTYGQVVIDNAMSVAYLSGDVSLAESVSDQTTPYPACGGYRERIETPSWPATPVGAVELSKFTAASGTNRLTLSGRIVAMWFDAAGVPTEVALDVTKTCAATAQAAIAFSGQNTYRAANQVLDGACALSSYAQVEWYRQTDDVSWTVDYALQISLRCGAVQLTRSASCTATFSGQVVQQGAAATSSAALSRQFAMFGQAWTHQEVSPGVRERPPLYAFSSRDAEPVLGMAPFWYLPRDTASADVHRWSNNLIGLTTTWTVAGQSGRSMAALSPSGATAVIAESPPDAARLYGSYNPVTGEALIASADPVCWT